jgi:hypothetical protein
MKKTTLLSIILTASTIYLSAQSFKQDFDDENKSNWDYTTNIPFYSLNNGTDIWAKKGENARIPSAYSGTTFLAGRDLDNPHSQSLSGVASPEHILYFEPVYIGGLTAEISFRVHYVGIDKGDYIYYQLAFNNGAGWSSYDSMENVFKTTQNGNFNSTGWEEFKHIVPSGHNFVRMRLVVYQNGNEYLGFDDFEVKTQTLSNDKNAIEGFTFGPNPTNGPLRLKANVILDSATVYNILGKELINVNGGSKEIELNLAQYTSGIYLVRVKSGQSTQSIRVINK